jgi:O-antigen ligase
MRLSRDSGDLSLNNFMASPFPTLQSKSFFDLSTLLSGIILLCAGLLLSITILHWGGAYPDMAVYLYPLGAVLWLSLGVKAWVNQSQRQPLGNQIDLAVILFLAYAAYSYHLSPSPYLARFEFLWILTYAGLFLGLRLGLHKRRWATSLLVLILILAALSCGYALLNRGVHQHLIWGLPRPDYGDRISGTFGCPNHFANLMVMASCLALSFFFSSRSSWVFRILCLYLAGMFTLGLFFSVSRGGYLAWMTGLFVIICFFILQRHISLQLRIGMMACGLIIAAGAAYSAFQNPYVKARIDATWAGDVRLYLAQDALKIWKTQPLLGTGMASFDHTHQRITETILSTRAKYTHNDYLNLLADYGAIGAALCLLFFLLVLYSLFKKQAQAEREFDFMTSRSALWVIAVMAVHSVFDFNFHIPACALTFFCVLAIGTSPSLQPQQDKSPFFLPGAFLGLLALPIACYLTLVPIRMHPSIQVAQWKEDQLLALSSEELKKLGDQLYAQDPQAGPALENLADALRVKTAEINQAYKAAQRSGDAAEAQRLLLQREKEGQASLHLYQRASEANLIDDGLWLKQGLTFDILDRSSEAYLSYSKALENQPNNNFFQYHLGFHLLKVGEYDLAKELFASAKKINSHLNLDREQRALAEKALRILQEMEKANLRVPATP